MSKGLFFFLIGLAALALLCVWGGPRLYRTIVGESLLVTVNSTMVIEEPVQTETGDEVLKTIASIEIFFPMGTAPESTSELMVTDNEGQPVEVYWSSPSREDIPDKKQTRWFLEEVFFPAGFRQGTLKNKVRELAQIRLQQPPYNAK